MESSIFGKKISTIGLCSSGLYIKKFEKGARIKRRNGGKIWLNKGEISDLIMFLRDIETTWNFIPEHEIIRIGYKYPKTMKFVQRVCEGKVTDDEAKKILAGYQTKVDIIEALKDGKES